MPGANPSLEDIEHTLDRFLHVITPTLGDPTYSVLRAHLLFEELLRDFIEKQFTHPEALEGARLTFAQLLALSKASSKPLEPDDWRWTALEKLNRLRNLLAHNIEAAAVAQKVKELVEYVVSQVGLPLPDPAERLPAGGSVPSTGARYTAIDMVLCGLHAQMTALLGFDVTLRLAQEEKRATDVARKLDGGAP